MWAVNHGNNNSWTYYTGWLFVASVLNLVGYLLNMPAMFALTAAIYYVAFPILLASCEGIRAIPHSQRSNEARADYGGSVVLLIGAALSFFGAPFGGLSWGSIIDIVMLVVVAVFDIIGAAIFANLGGPGSQFAAQIFVILAIFALGILFGSRGLLYAACVLATTFFMFILPNAGFGTNNNSTTRKATAAATMSFIGMVITAFWVVISLHVFREDSDLLDGGDAAATNNTNANANKGQNQA